MKTTIELSDPLFQSAKQFAQESQTTLRALIEEGLRRVLSEQATNPKQVFKLKNASVRGNAMLIPDPTRANGRARRPSTLLERFRPRASSHCG